MDDKTGLTCVWNDAGYAYFANGQLVYSGLWAYWHGGPPWIRLSIDRPAPWGAECPPAFVCSIDELEEWRQILDRRKGL